MYKYNNKCNNVAFIYGINKLKKKITNYTYICNHSMNLQ